MPIRDSQDLTLSLAQTTAKARDSQDLTLALANTTGQARDSQEVILVLAVPIVRDEDFWWNPVRPVPASLFQKLPYSPLLGDQEELPAGFLLEGQPDEDFWANPVPPVKASLLRLYLFDAPEMVQAPAPLQPDEDFWRNAVAAVVARNAWPQPFSFEVHESAPIFIIGSRADKQSIQVHPVLRPLDFYTAPRKQPGRSRATFTTLLTEAGASRAFSMPLGARNQPIAGKVFAFTMGGLISIGAVGGTMTITPLYGATGDGVNLGQSISHSYQASTLLVPWRLKGEIIFQEVSLEPGASLVICTGSFAMSGVSIVFGSGVPIRVNAGAISAAASGALNFAATFAPSVLNVAPPTIGAKYAFLRVI